EIAARDHQRIGVFDDPGETLDRLRLLDLGEYAGAAAGDLLYLGQVFRALDEGKGDPVDIAIERGLEVGAVLRRQRAEADGRIRDVDAFAVGEAPTHFDRGDRVRLRAFADAQADLPVVKEKTMAGLECRQDLRMGQLDPPGVARDRFGIEREGVAML